MYRTKLTRQAEEDVRAAAAYIRRASPRAAQKWLSELRRRVDSLRDQPARFALIPESDSLGKPYHSVHHYSHRIIYRIDTESAIVFIVRVYHGARMPLEPGDLEETPP